MRYTTIRLLIPLVIGTITTNALAQDANPIAQNTDPIAQDADPCEKVTCSNHGDCVVKSGEPACACHEGYTPDTTTGMSCQPVPHENAQDSAPVAPATTQKTSDGWGLGAAIAGFAVTPVALGLGIGAVATTDEGYDDAVPIGFGASALLVIGAVGPVIHAGGRSARYGAGVKGILGARIAAWVLYGLTLANGLAEIGLTVAGVSIQKWQVAVLVGTGTLSLALFSIDALIAGKQARRKMEQSAKSTHQFMMSPSIAPVFANGQASGATLGLGGVF